MLGPVPSDVNDLWMEWEAHPSPMPFINPWIASDTLAAVPPPPLLTQINYLLEFYRDSSTGNWAVRNASSNAGGVPACGNPVAAYDGNGNMHVFARGLNSSFLEFVKAPDPQPGRRSITPPIRDLREPESQGLRLAFRAQPGRLY